MRLIGTSMGDALPPMLRPPRRSAVAEGFGVEIGAGLDTGLLGAALGSQDDALPREFESLATANVPAGDHFVDANHIGARIGETLAVLRPGAAREFFLFGAHHPANGIRIFLAAMRANQG